LEGGLVLGSISDRRRLRSWSLRTEERASAKSLGDNFRGRGPPEPRQNRQHRCRKKRFPQHGLDPLEFHKKWGRLSSLPFVICRNLKMNLAGRTACLTLHGRLESLPHERTQPIRREGDWKSSA